MSRQPATQRKPATRVQPEFRRLIVTLPNALHRRIKLSCASRGIPMAEAVREALERTAWPLQDVS